MFKTAAAWVWEKIKAFFAWVYKWVTVLTGIIATALSAGVDQLDAWTGIHFEAFFTEQTALRIVAGIAVIKALVATTVAAVKKKD